MEWTRGRILGNPSVQVQEFFRRWRSLTSMAAAAAAHSRRTATLLAAGLVALLCLAGAGNSATATVDTTPPGAPTGVYLQFSPPDLLVVNWVWPTDNVGVAGYDVYVGAVKRATTQSYIVVINQVTCGQQYTISVIAFDAAGNRSAPGLGSITTPPCAGTTPPPAPSPPPPPSGGSDSG